jgi:hypothetical protein
MINITSKSAHLLNRYFEIFLVNTAPIYVNTLILRTFIMGKGD